MKKILICVLVVLFIVTGCGETQVTTTEKIASHVETVFRTEDTSVKRNEIAELKKLVNDDSLSVEERMFAQYSYNIAYSITKLVLSGKSVSVFDFPEMELMLATIGEIRKGELKINEDIVSESENFFRKVEEFLK